MFIKKLNRNRLRIRKYWRDRFWKVGHSWTRKNLYLSSDFHINCHPLDQPSLVFQFVDIRAASSRFSMLQWHSLVKNKQSTIMPLCACLCSFLSKLTISGFNLKVSTRALRSGATAAYLTDTLHPVPSLYFVIFSIG